MSEKAPAVICERVALEFLVLRRIPRLGRALGVR
jgi:hypothetical protein